MPIFKFVGPNPSFAPIERSAGSALDATDISLADLIRQAIGYKEPVLSVNKFDFEISLRRVLTPIEKVDTSSDGHPDGDEASFVLDIDVRLAKNGAPESSPESAFFLERYGDNTIKRSFVVYGDAEPEIAIVRPKAPPVFASEGVVR